MPATLTTTRLIKDGDAAVKPIAHLYKPGSTSGPLRSPRDEIRTHPPTTDTYSLPRSQQEVFLSLPYQGMDACLYAHNHGVPVAAVAAALGGESTGGEPIRG